MYADYRYIGGSGALHGRAGLRDRIVRQAPAGPTTRWQYEGKEWTGEIADGFTADEAKSLRPEDVRKIQRVPDRPPSPNAERDRRMSELLAEAYADRHLRDIPTDVLMRMNPADLEWAWERRRAAKAAERRPRPKTWQERHLEELIANPPPAPNLTPDFSEELAAEARAVKVEAERRREEARGNWVLVQQALWGALALVLLALVAALNWRIRSKSAQEEGAQ